MDLNLKQQFNSISFRLGLLNLNLPIRKATATHQLPCADPGIFVKGGGGPGQSDRKKALTTFFFFF